MPPPVEGEANSLQQEVFTMDKAYLDCKFGMEIEFTGIPRHKVSYILSQFFQAPAAIYVSDTGRKTYRIKDKSNRTWRVKSDGSIEAQTRRPNGRPQRATEDYRVELITPPLRYSKDIQTLMEIMKQIVAAGAFVNDTCGIHIHLDGKNHTAQTLKNLCNIVANRTELLDLTLRTEPYRRFHYCKDMDEDFLLEINKTSFLTLEDIEESWYDGWDEPRDKRYHQSRYCFLNLHCYFHGNKTVELRCFNSTLDCEEIRAYIALALGINFLAMTTKYTWYKPVMVDNPRYTMTHFLQRIGLKGSEFASCRQILTRHLTGDPNWR